MIIGESEEIKLALRSYRNFEECLLADVKWMHFGTILEFHINYIWTEDSQVRTRILEEPRLVVLRAYAVQELHILNGLTRAMVENLNNVNWGISEVAQIVLVESGSMQHCSEKNGIKYNHLAIEWEGDRRIDVILAALEIVSVR